MFSKIIFSQILWDLKIHCPPYNQTIIYYKDYSSPTMFANTLLLETIFLQPLFIFNVWFKFYTHHHELQNLQPKLFYYLEKPKTLIVMGWCHSSKINYSTTRIPMFKFGHNVISSKNKSKGHDDINMAHSC
jgi:hypothetical protein